MARRETRRSTARRIAKQMLRFGPPLTGLLVIGQAGVRSVGGDIQRWAFAPGVLLILAGFASKLVPER